MKKVLLFVTMITTVCLNINATFTQEEEQQFSEWVDRREKIGERLSDWDKSEMAKRIKAVNTPEYKAKEEQEKIIDVLHAQLQEDEDSVFVDPSYVDYRKQIVKAEIAAAWKNQRTLAEVACSTPAYKAWYGQYQK